MSTIIEILTAAALILSIIIPGGAFLLGERNKKRYKKSLAVNCFFFFGIVICKVKSESYFIQSDFFGNIFQMLYKHIECLFIIHMANKIMIAV